MIKTKIVDLIKKAIREKIEIEVFVPENEKFGHYSTNVALKLGMRKPEQSSMRKTHANKENPLKVAENLKSSILNLKSNFLEKIEVAPPGFINFWLSEKALQDELKEILKKKQNYGKPKIHNSRFKIQVEYVSANPTGPLTLANGRGGFFGDALSNILEFCGHKVEREYYVNDTGNQILVLGKSILAAAGLLKQEENFYKGDYIGDWAKKHSSIIKKQKTNPLKIGQAAGKDFLAAIKKTVGQKAGIKFNRWTSEAKHVHKKNFISKALNLFRKKNLIYKKDGALWLKTTGFGDDKDRVLITGDDFPTYFLADAGHYLETKTRGLDSKINILGPDHFGYVNRIQAAAKIIGLENSKIIVTQAVRLMSKGKEAKMSKRKGEYITLEDLIKEVGLDAARFFFLMYSPDTHMNFDLDLAKERSLKNPVYYVQYAAVRAQSILTKANFKFKILNFKLDPLNTPEDLNLMRMLARFPEVIDEAAENYNPQVLARYSLDLAREFHNFYEKERIIGARKDLMTARLALIHAILIIFKNIFLLLGIGLPKNM